MQSLDGATYKRQALAKECGIVGCAAMLKDGVIYEVGCGSELSAMPAM